MGRDALIAVAAFVGCLVLVGTAAVTTGLLLSEESAPEECRFPPGLVVQTVAGKLLVQIRSVHPWREACEYKVRLPDMNIRVFQEFELQEAQPDNG